MNEPSNKKDPAEADKKIEQNTQEPNTQKVSEETIKESK